MVENDKKIASIISMAEQGDTEAQYTLGYYYEDGIGVKEDKEKSFYWYKKAAEQGNKIAKVKLKELGKLV